MTDRSSPMNPDASIVSPASEKPVTSAAVPFQPTSVDIWDTKYRLKDNDGVPVDQTMDDTHKRVARALADAEIPEKREEWYEKFLWALRNGAIGAGRITSNAGAQAYKPATSLINCVVSGTIEDSMDSIMTRVYEGAMTLRKGSGIGYDMSTMRPKGAFVAGAGASTSGPLSFMDIFDKMCFTVASAGGRRGAQMATFDVGHPDVLDFIRAKREAGRLRQFNLSLLITDGFMKAVEDDAMWPLAFPIHQKEASKYDLDNPAQILWRDWPSAQNLVVRESDGLVACRIYKTVKAQNLWNAIMASTYDFAEPGFILIDKVNDDNNNWWMEKIRATNPCVAGGTWCQTSEGPRLVRDLVGVPFTAMIDGIGYATTAPGFFKTAKKSVLSLQTKEGYRLRLTEDHLVRWEKSRKSLSGVAQWRQAGELKPGDLIVINDHRSLDAWDGPLTYEQGYLLGLLVGDGTLDTDKAVLSVWENKSSPDLVCGGTAVMNEALRCALTLSPQSDVPGWLQVEDRDEWRMPLPAIRSLAIGLGMSPGDKAITPALEQTSSASYRGFLRGFFDADGSVQGNSRSGLVVRLAQSDIRRLEAAQRMLLRLGIPSTIFKNRRKSSKALLSNGQANGQANGYGYGYGGVREYEAKSQHELNISGESLIRFQDIIGFSDSEKSSKLRERLLEYKMPMKKASFLATIDVITPDGCEDVYDVQVPGINAFDANGLYVHNCGEQPLPPYGACLLGSVNLTRFVLDPFTDKARFDWEKYRLTVRYFTRMLDNVVEGNNLPLEQQRDEITRKRRHGMGFLGLGSTLTMLKIPYGSPASLTFTEEVSREMALVGWKVAAELSEEKGPAPALAQEYPVTAAMLRQRPEMAADGYELGDMVPGRILHARYSRYMQRIATVDPGLVDRLASIGARFTHHTSIAPTGTISLSLANNASNGIEPSFAHHYARNVIRSGRKTKEKVDVFSFELLAYRTLINPKAMPGSDDPQTTLPDYFITADQVSPMQHVDVQAAAQPWIDSAISKTANVPTDFPYEDFKGIYLYAYKKGLKGCTTFRFNPAAFQGVLVKEKDLENTLYTFRLEGGEEVVLKGNEEVEYDGETHTAANLFDALKEGYYGKL